MCANTAAGVASWISAVVTMPTAIFLPRLTISAIVSTLGCLSASGLLPSYTPIALTEDLCPVMYADIELAESVAIESYPDVVTWPRKSIRSISSSPWYLPSEMPLDRMRAAVIADWPMPSPRQKMTFFTGRARARARTTSLVTLACFVVEPEVTFAVIVYSPALG